MLRLQLAMCSLLNNGFFHDSYDNKSHGEKAINLTCLKLDSFVDNGCYLLVVMLAEFWDLEIVGNAITFCLNNVEVKHTAP